MLCTQYRSKPSYEIATYPEKLGPQRKEIYRCFNAYHEANRLMDTAAMSQLKSTVPGLLEIFGSTEANESDNPKWRRNTTLAGWHCALGQFDVALEYEIIGWNAALEADHHSPCEKVDKQKSISSSNIADQLNRLDRFAEARNWAETSCLLWNTNPINQLVFSISLFHCGEEPESESIFRELIQFVELNGKGALQVAIFEDLLIDVTVPGAADLIQAVYQN